MKIPNLLRLLALMAFWIGAVVPASAQSGNVLTNEDEETTLSSSRGSRSRTSGASRSSVGRTSRTNSGTATRRQTTANPAGSLTRRATSYVKASKLLISAQVANVAAGFPSRYARSGSFPYAKGTENGNLGCANVVSAALKAAGIRIAGGLNVDVVKNQLVRAGWKVRRPPPFKPGDVIVWSPRPKHKHIGIMARRGNTLMAMNNSSSQRRPSWSSPTYRPVECVLRLED